MSFREADYENAVMELLEELGYTLHYGPDITRDYKCPLYLDDLQVALDLVNPDVPAEVLESAQNKLLRLEQGTLVQQNKTVTDWLQNGMEIAYREDGQDKTALVRLIDYDNTENNLFAAINQWTVVEREEKRPDIVLFVNGLPLVVVELKSASREDVEISHAYNQLRNYMQVVPSLFAYNAFCIISNLAETRAGTITANEARFMEWKSIDGSYEETRHAQFNVLFEGMLEHSRLLDILENFICFSKNTPDDAKILAAYHQYFAVNKAIERAKIATQTDGKGGVFWHTQGSGKSLSMVFYAKLLQKHLESPTVVVLTDRNDLDDQLYGQFSDCKDFLRQSPLQAESREHLKELLDGRQANGIFFSTMQKFEESEEPLSERRNIIVMSDEAHRSQYGLTEKIKQDGSIVKGAARVIRDSLPNATYIGFTGTPVSSKDRNTQEVFGDYIDVYDMTQAVLDGATRPVYYESRVINLGLDEEVLRQIDDTYEMMATQANEQDIEKSKKELGNMEAILGAAPTIDSLCNDIIEHYETTRENLLTGKAMIVAYSRPIAMKIYEKLLSLRPQWKEKVKVVMTSGNNDPEEWKAIIGTKSYKTELATKFKNNDDPMKIAIVVDMWLTGFDVPSLATMYVYKPMADHNLMQAIARVNRVFKDKEGGLVVDYIGIASALKKAMKDYTIRDQKNYGDPDIAQTALPEFKKQLEICDDIFYGYDYAAITNPTITNKQRATVISGGIDFVLGLEESVQKAFLKHAMALRQAKSLCQSLLTEKQRLLSAYMETVRVASSKITSPEKLSLKEINQQINSLLEQSVKSEGIINLFSDVDEEFSIFDGAFLTEVANMKTKNLAAELLKKLLAEQIIIYQRTNLIQAEKFSERMKATINRYRAGQLTNAEVIDELKKMALEIKHAYEHGDSLGLTHEELAFYDALTKPQAVKDFYDDAQLTALTEEVTEMLRKNRTVDWQKQESARAQMRIMVKRLLKKYKYPPDEANGAVDIVIRQCELWADMVY
ncbi:MAG: type I restriction endonuclease subunit R [Clostridiales bacterium]|nr:type I restriction endonuclease subunit R [Clostridiales bacterium]